ncbi:MAG: hypothetical protein AABZ74_01725 [Cyanobacteriota bacterium]
MSDEKINEEIGSSAENMKGIKSDFEEKLKKIEEERANKILIQDISKKDEKSSKVSIVDISKKKNKHKKLDISLKKEFFKFSEENSENLMKPLIYLGGSVIGITKLTTQALSDFGTLIINQKNKD